MYLTSTFASWRSILADDLPGSALPGWPVEYFLPSVHRRLLSLSKSSYFRLLRNLRFLLSTWAFQVRINRRRAHVLLSTLRNFPLLDGDHSEIFARIAKRPDTHVMVLWGEEDSLVPPCILQQYQRVLPNLHLQRISQSDHSLFLQKATIVSESIAKFFGPSPCQLE